MFEKAFKNGFYKGKINPKKSLRCASVQFAQIYRLQLAKAHKSNKRYW